MKDFYYIFDSTEMRQSQQSGRDRGQPGGAQETSPSTDPEAERKSRQRARRKEIGGGKTEAVG